MRFSVHLCQRKTLDKHLRFSIHVSHASFIPPLVSKIYAPSFCHVRTSPVSLIINKYHCLINPHPHPQSFPNSNYPRFLSRLEHPHHLPSPPLRLYHIGIVVLTSTDTDLTNHRSSVSPDLLWNTRLHHITSPRFTVSPGRHDTWEVGL